MGISVLLGLAKEMKDGRPFATRTLWAETTPQHFQYPLGMFQRTQRCNPVSNPSSCKPEDWMCVPTGSMERTLATDAVGEERNGKVFGVFQSLGATDLIPILPLHKLALARWESHWDSLLGTFHFHYFSNDSLAVALDCTHFAYSPTFYAPVWHELLQLLRGM